MYRNLLLQNRMKKRKKKINKGNEVDTVIALWFFISITYKLAF